MHSVRATFPTLGSCWQKVMQLKLGGFFCLFCFVLAFEYVTISSQNYFEQKLWCVCAHAHCWLLVWSLISQLSSMFLLWCSFTDGFTSPFVQTVSRILLPCLISLSLSVSLSVNSISQRQSLLFWLARGVTTLKETREEDEQRDVFVRLWWRDPCFSFPHFSESLLSCGIVFRKKKKRWCY